MQHDKTLNTRDNLSEVISLIVNIDDKAIDERLTVISDNQDFSNNLDAAAIIDVIDYNVYCSKTGQVISRWTEQEISLLIGQVGKKRAQQIINIKSVNQIAPQWLFTDDIALNKLAESDPIGYFVHALTAVLIEFQSFAQEFQSRDSTEARLKMTALKAVVYRQASLLPLNAIVRVNELMRRYLSIIQSTAAYKFLAFVDTRMEYIAHSIPDLEQFEQGIQETIGNILQFETKRNRIKATLTYQEVMDLKLRYKGHSNFRNQKKLNSMTETEHVAYLLKDFMTDLTPTQLQIKAGKEPEKSGVELKTHTGELTLKIKEPEEKPLKLSFAAILKRRK